MLKKKSIASFSKILKFPEDFEKGAPVLRLLKGLYGLKQDPRIWNDATLHRLNFTRCNSDPYLYVRKEKSEFVIIALYVDDLVVTCNSSDLLSKIKVALKENYKMTDLGELSWCLGIQVTQCQDSVRLSQRTFILKMLERFGMQDCKPCKTPTAVHSRRIAFQREKVYLRRTLKDIRASLISDVCHDRDKTRYRFRSERILEVCIKTWQESSYCC